MRHLMLAAMAASIILCGPASAATTVDIPFPPRVELPVHVPAYTVRKDSWPISVVFSPFVAVFAAIGTAIAPEQTKSLRKTAAVIIIDGAVGKRKYSNYRKQPKKVAVSQCRPVGNWVGAPCQ